jgi:hypothetical protein
MFARKGVGSSSCYQQSPYLGVKYRIDARLLGSEFGIWLVPKEEFHA